MRRLILAGLVAAAVVGVSIPALARAIAVPYFQPQNKTQVADLIVTGQVVGIEDQDVKASIAPNVNNQVMYRIAVIQVTDTLKGKVEGNMVRVGFMAPQAVPQPGLPGQPQPGGIGVGPAVLPGVAPAIQPVRPPVKAVPPAPPADAVPPAPAKEAPAAPAKDAPVQNQAQAGAAIQIQGGGVVKVQAQGGQIQAIQIQVQPGQPGQVQILPAQPIQGGPIQIQPAPFPGKKPFPIQNVNIPLQQGQEGLFYLKKHHEGKFYVIAAPGGFVSAQNKDQLDNEVAQIKVTADPMGSLKAAKAEDRFNAARVLIQQYRQPMYYGPKGPQQQPVDAEQSKLILKALMEADWATSPQNVNYQKNPNVLFNQLGLQPKDGWTQPVGQGVYSEGYAQAAKNWLEKNWQTYRLQKFVGGPGGNPYIGPVPGVEDRPVPLPVPVPLPAPAPGVQGGGAPGNVGGPVQPGGIGIAVPLPAPVDPAPAPQPERK